MVNDEIVMVLSRV